MKEKGREEILRMKENFFVSPVSSMSSKLSLDIYSPPVGEYTNMQRVQITPRVVSSDASPPTPPPLMHC